MKKTLCVFGTVVFLCVFIFGTVFAQEKGVNSAKATVKTPDNENVEIERQVEIFYRVVAAAETQKDPLIMLGAIRMFDELQFTGIVKPGKTDTQPDSVYDRMYLLREAKKYANEDAEMIALLEKIERSPETTEVRGHPGRRGPGSPGGPGRYYAHGGGPRGVYHGYRHHGPYYDHGPYATCFIATAAYGSPFAERVETLRRFRDRWLVTHSLGAAFVDFYYKHSPSLADAISRSSVARAATRTVLYPVTVVAGACMGQIADILRLITGIVLFTASIALILWRKNRLNPHF